MSHRSTAHPRFSATLILQCLLQIVNAANILPPVGRLFEEVNQLQQTAHPQSNGPRHQSAWFGFPGPDMNLSSRNNAAPGYSYPPIQPLHVGPRATPQQPPMASLRLSPRGYPGTLPPIVIETGQPRGARPQTQVSAPEPAVSNRMGGRYAQTPRHSNGQPHAPGLRPPEQQPPLDVSHARTRTRPTTSRTSGRSSRTKHDSGDPTKCMHCHFDNEVEKRRQLAGTTDPVFAKFYHGQKPQIPTPLPPPMDGIIMIAFNPKLSSSHMVFGVSMAEILDFRDCMENPREQILNNGTEKVLLTIEAKGYPTIVRHIAGNCRHRPISRFNLAIGACNAYFFLFQNHTFDASAIRQGQIVVKSVCQLRLCHLWSHDGKNWRAHVAYVL
ncbi:hypothetical protein B0H10DRAFT_2068584 [Mycena sp. CBHHK59/15]|nr:hypothetical protein B0H10DRAFT_2068584 [Mycena sp. CBHHK59/15]